MPECLPRVISCARPRVNVGGRGGFVGSADVRSDYSRWWPGRASRSLSGNARRRIGRNRRRRSRSNRGCLKSDAIHACKPPDLDERQYSYTGQRCQSDRRGRLRRPTGSSSGVGLKFKLTAGCRRGLSLHLGVAGPQAGAGRSIANSYAAEACGLVDWDAMTASAAAGFLLERAGAGVAQW